jgi:hypothetical protein
MHTHATNRVGKTSLQNCQILEIFLSKIQFSLREIQIYSTAFCFLQRLSAFFNGFPIFFNGFLLSSIAFCDMRNLRKSILFSSTAFLFPRNPMKFNYGSKYTKDPPFELCISRHLLPELRNSRYNVYILPNTFLWCTCVPNSAPNLKSKLKYNLSRI